MTNKNKSLCYGSLVEKIKEIDLTMESLEGTIEELKKSLSLVPDTDEEICPDEIGSEKALLELLKDAFDDFIKIHVIPHPTNKTIITFEDGEQTIYDGG